MTKLLEGNGKLPRQAFRNACQGYPNDYPELFRYETDPPAQTKLPPDYLESR